MDEVVEERAPRGRRSARQLLEAVWIRRFDQLGSGHEHLGEHLDPIEDLAALRQAGEGVTGKVVAAGLATFHGLGALASLWTAAPSFEVYRKPLALGAVIVHSALALGFVATFLVMTPQG